MNHADQLSRLMNATSGLQDHATADPLLAPAEALGLPIAPEWEESVLFHLRLLLTLGAEVAAEVARMPGALDPLPLDRPPEDR